jgi:hypothetical protein
MKKVVKHLSPWFHKNNIRGIALAISAILYVFCDDHTDKIITAVMVILTIDSFTRRKERED